MGTACSVGLKQSSIVGLSGEDGHIKDDFNKSNSISSSLVYSSL